VRDRPIIGKAVAVKCDVGSESDIMATKSKSDNGRVSSQIFFGTDKQTLISLSVHVGRLAEEEGFERRYGELEIRCSRQSERSGRTSLR
jgi:hypothetical protein